MATWVKDTSLSIGNTPLVKLNRIVEGTDAPVLAKVEGREKWVIDRRLEQMKAEGVEFKPGVTIGKDITGEQLRKRFDAVGLTMGAEQPRELPVPGRELKGVHLERWSISPSRTNGRPVFL